MVLKLKPLSIKGAAKPQERVKVSTASGAKQAHVAAVKQTPPPADERTAKSVTVRLPPSHLEKLEALQTRLECDRSEVIKRAIRLAYAAFTPDEASLVTTENGDKTVQPLVLRGSVV